MTFSKVTKLGRSRIYRNAVNHLGVITNTGVVYWGFTCEEIQLHADIMLHVGITPDDVAGVFRAIGDREVLVDFTACGNADWHEVIQRLLPDCPIQLDIVDSMEATLLVYRFYKHERDVMATV